jgi:hypothetical protein
MRSEYAEHLERVLRSYVRIVGKLMEEEDRWRWAEELEEAKRIMAEAYEIAAKAKGREGA